MAKLFVTMVDAAKTDMAMGLGNTCLYVVECYSETQAERVAAYAEQIPAYREVRVRASKPKSKRGMPLHVECVSVHETPNGWPD
jgi:hypothetical protein